MVQVKNYDVIVVGGGAGGISAAVGAAQCGAKTLLIERRAYLGGAATGSSVLTYCGFYTQGEHPIQVVFGVGSEVLDRLATHGLSTEPFHTRTDNSVILLEAEHTKLVFDEMVCDHGIDIILHTNVIAANTEHRRIQSITCFEDRGTFKLEASAFVDASGNSNLAAYGGGNVAELSSKERQRGSLVVRFGGVEFSNGKVQKATSLSGLTEAIAQANLERSTPLPLPHGFVGRLPITRDVIAILIDLDVDALSAQSLTESEMLGRKYAWEYLEVFKRFIPEFSNAYLSSTGPELGIRQGRRVHTKNPVTGDITRQGTQDDTMIARAGWPMEFHRSDGTIHYESVGGPGWFGIGYGALVPENIDNLFLAGRTIGADSDAYASIRVMGTAFATGHAAGVSAANWAETQKHNYKDVQAILEKQGAALQGQ